MWMCVFNRELIFFIRVVRSPQQEITNNCRNSILWCEHVSMRTRTTCNNPKQNEANIEMGEKRKKNMKKKLKEMKLVIKKTVKTAREIKSI